MMRTKYLFIVTVVLSAIIMFTSCQEEPTSVEPQDATQQGLSKFSIPDGATYVSATFNIHLRKWEGIGDHNKDIILHRITNPWEEMVVTFNNFGGSYAPEVEGTFNATALGYYSSDVTALVGNWLDGTHPNYGLLLDSEPKNPKALFNSRKNVNGNHPYLEICYLLNGEEVCVQFEPIGDATIYELWPDSTLGHLESLFVGWWNVSPYDNQAILKFDIEPTVGQECTRIAIYWQRHTQYGPKPRDTNWDLIQPSGENSDFFLSEKSFYEVLQTSPWGNSYFALARQYIAAKLNVLSGASIPAEVESAFNSATELLNTYTPVEVGSWRFRHPIRRQFRLKAFKLLRYNSGIIGPGRCGSL